MRPMNSIGNWVFDVASVIARIVVLAPVLIVARALRRGRK